MSNDTGLRTEWERKAAEIGALLPRLAYLRAEIAEHGREPIGVVIPESMNPGAYDGPDATDAPAQMMGLPVTWGQTVGLIYGA